MSRPRVSLLGQFEEIVAGAALVVVVLSVCWGVVTRYITEQPATWAGEVAAMAFAWMVFIGASAALKRGMHVHIDMLLLALPRGPRRVMTLAADTVVLVFLATGLVLATEFAVDSWDNPTSVLRLPLTTIYAAVMVGFACLLWRYIAVARQHYRAPVAE
ncbi:MAG: TRAP transporter small permease [Rhodospirillales bacterium]|nr:TRAP transporter small permease [Rhodospirillales bacterium]